MDSEMNIINKQNSDDYILTVKNLKKYYYSSRFSMDKSKKHIYFCFKSDGDITWRVEK